jgi:hypothetical protein
VAARDASDRGVADCRRLVDLPVRFAREQMRHHAPAVAHRFAFGRRAQVVEERAHLLDAAQRQQRLAQRAFGAGGIEFWFDLASLHWISVLTR